MRFLKRNKDAEKDNGQTGAAFSQNKNIQQDTGSPTRIPNAGGSIVTKSILSGESRLKWLFRQEGGEGNGVYSGYWGLDSHDAPTELIVPFMNPSYF